MSKIVLVATGGYQNDEDSEEFLEDLVRLFERCLNMIVEKNERYGNAWRQQGWQGNLARILSKTARLKAMCWGEHEKPGFGETVEDTGFDLINITSFFLLNRANDNKWGDSRG